jgi:hypothetical protein
MSSDDLFRYHPVSVIGTLLHERRGVMRTFALLALLVAALTLPGTAGAATPQGKLTGSAVLLVPSGWSWKFSIGETVTDGGTSYVGLENDESGTCSGDTGIAGPAAVGLSPIVCAHYVDNASPKMRFALKGNAYSWLVVKITDKPNTFAWLYTATLAEAKAVVNLGLEGSGVTPVTPTTVSWVSEPIASGGYTVTP